MNSISIFEKSRLLFLNLFFLVNIKAIRYHSTPVFLQNHTIDLQIKNIHMKMLIMIAVITSTAFSAFAQKIDASKVPSAVKASFAKQFPGVIPKWEKENGNYEVNFKQNDNKMSVLIEPNGSIKETETNIKVADLPETVLAFLKEHYKSKPIKEAAKITKADGTVNYEAEVEGIDVIFDANGKFLREVKD